MNRNLLIVTPYYYPDIAANVGLMKDFSEYLGQKYSVTVYTNELKNSHNQFEQDYSEIPICRIKRTANPFVHFSGLIFKIFEYIVFYIGVYIYIKNRSSKFPVIFCQSTPPLISIIIRFASDKKTKIIYNVQDLFPDSLIAYFGNRKYRMLHRLETGSYKTADGVTVICEEFAQRIKFHSGVVAKVIPNWIDTNVIHYIDKDKNSISKLLYKNSYENKKIVYSGNIGFNQDFDTVLDAAMEMCDVDFFIIGRGAKRTELKKKVSDRKIENVYLFEPFPKEKISEVYSFGDVYILPMKKNSMKGSFPSKTWSILACGSSLVACVDKDSSFAKEMGKNRLALICEPENKDDMVRNLRIALLNGRRDSEEKIGYIKTHYDKMLLLEQYKEIINNFYE